MLTPSDLDHLIATLTAHGFPPATAEAIAVEVGDTPLIIDGQVHATTNGIEHTFPAKLLDKRPR